MIRPLLALLIVVPLGCSGRQQANNAPSAAGAQASSVPTGAEAPAASVASTAAVPDGSAPEAPVAPEPLPPPVKRTGKVWPFHAWDRAEAVTFNQFRIRPGAPLYAYDEKGWSPHLVDRKPITVAQAKSAVDLVTQTQGDVAVSKCPFPRHAVVLYEGEVPIASINVCFSCGDILLWPRWSPAPDWGTMTTKQLAEYELFQKKQLVMYEKAFPRWKGLFRDGIGFPIDEAYDH